MKEIKRYLDERIGEYSFYFEDIDSGYTYSFNERIKMPAASCIKVPIAITLLKEVEDNNLTLESRLFVKKDEMIGGSGIIHEFDERDYSLRELLLAMLIHSDNTATNKIIDLIGFDKVNETIKKMELRDTSLKRKMIDPKYSDKGMETLSTSLDLAKCLKVLYKKTYLNEENSAVILDILRRVQNRNKLPFYIPKREWESIANKPGSLKGVENDAALLTISKGNFLITMMSKTLPNNVYGIATISRVGKMIWDIIERNWT